MGPQVLLRKSLKCHRYRLSRGSFKQHLSLFKQHLSQLQLGGTCHDRTCHGRTYRNLHPYNNYGSSPISYGTSVVGGYGAPVVGGYGGYGTGLVGTSTIL